MNRKILLVAILFFSMDTYGQCAMCRAVVEQGGEEVADIVATALSAETSVSGQGAGR